MRTLSLLAIVVCFSTVVLGAPKPAAKEATVYNSYVDDWEYYSADGTGNNEKNPKWGSAGEKLLYNFKPVSFATWKKDKKAQNPRVVSNVASSAKHNQPRVTPRNVTDFLTVWAQFLDHDIVLTPAGDDAADIAVPKCDKWFDPECSGNKSIPFKRSIKAGPGEFDHPNVITAWIDGSQIYGSSLNVQKALRAFTGGRLAASKRIDNDEGEWPILVSEVPTKYKKFINMANDAKTRPTENLFACGDVRCNEQPLLLSMQILFFREHNRIARQLEYMYPTWNDETLFQRARAYVIAQLQRITFKEYLFWLMGGRPFDIEYKGYDHTVNPDINVFFSTVAFRYGHSEVNHLIKRMLKGFYGKFHRSYYAQLREHFFDNRLTYEDGIGPIMQGMYENPQSSMDNEATDDIRVFLFAGPKQKPSADLIAIDIQRARDHGIPKYNVMRKAYGLDEKQTWDDFEPLDFDDEIDPNELRRFLKFLYPTPSDCDAFICGLSEDWVETDVTEAHDDYSNLGTLFEATLHEQFTRIRDGDRFWYEQDWILEALNSLGLGDVSQRTLADVIRDNTPKSTIVGNDVFVNFAFVGLSRKKTGVNSETTEIPILKFGW